MPTQVRFRVRAFTNEVYKSYLRTYIHIYHYPDGEVKRREEIRRAQMLLQQHSDPAILKPKNTIR